MLSRASFCLLRRSGVTLSNATKNGTATKSLSSLPVSSVPQLNALQQQHFGEQQRFFSDSSEKPALDCWGRSIYKDVDFTISEDATMYEAVQRFSAFNIGALVTVDGDGNMSGVVSERDYICKIALLGRTSKETKVKEIATRGPNLVTVGPSDSIEGCMHKMLSYGVRHLPLLDDDKKVIGMLSVKDLVKEVVIAKEKQIEKLAEHTFGKNV